MANSISDWNALSEAATRMHLSPILSQTIAGSNMESVVPQSVQANFSNAYNQVLARNIVLQQVFIQFAGILNSENIPVVPLKGIYLSETVYADIGLRHLSDIDVLVPENDIEKVRTIMESNGWQVEASIMRSKIEDSQFSQAHPYTLVKGDIRIELHIHLYSGGQNAKIPVTDLWEDTKRESFLGVEIRQFSKELLLQHQCLHLHKHLFGRELKIINFCDIREFLRVETEFDWSRFKRLAEKYQCKEPIAQVLALCSDFWDVEVPPTFLEFKGDMAEAETKFLSYINGTAGKTGNVLHRKFGRKSRDINQLKTYREKLQFVLGFMFPKKEFMRRNYGLGPSDWLLPWYLFRPLELSVKLLVAVLGRG